MLFDLKYKLNSGERLVGIVRKHWFLIVPRLAEFAIIIALLILFANKYISSNVSFAIAVILIAGFAVYLIYGWILLRIDYFIITSDRIIRITQKGVWNRNLNEIALSDIASIVMSEKGVASSILGFGSVKITLRDLATFNMTNIADPIKVYQGLVKLKGIKKQ